MFALACFERRQNALRHGFRFEQWIQVDSFLMQNTIAWGGLLQDEDRPAEPPIPSPPQGPDPLSYRQTSGGESIPYHRQRDFKAPHSCTEYLKSVANGSAWPQLMPFSNWQEFGNYIWSGCLVKYVNQLIGCCKQYAAEVLKLRHCLKTVEIDNAELKMRLQEALDAVDQLKSQVNASSAGEQNKTLHFLHFLKCARHMVDTIHRGALSTDMHTRTYR
jgi:hypothetical protein